MNFLEQVDQPTLIVNETIARRNIERMVAKARMKGVEFRPHFKTHQSADVAGWFKDAGVEKITVSSVEMAEYFADHGWFDILIAFSLNPRQIDRIKALAERVHLEVLVENFETLTCLELEDHEELGIWIKIDVGNHRTGLDWQQTDQVIALCERIKKTNRLTCMGLLTHSGHTYHADDENAVVRIFREGVDRLNFLRDRLGTSGISGLSISVGDTPGCSLCEDWSGIDEVRPGNFVFYDVQQVIGGACSVQDVALALACPVVAKHAERGEVVVHGGAVHLSKDTIQTDSQPVFGWVALPHGTGWGEPIEGAYVRSLSQEHGIVSLPAEEFANVEIGNLLFVIPAHSCLTVQVMGRYYTLMGRLISTLNR